MQIAPRRKDVLDTRIIAKTFSTQLEHARAIKERHEKSKNEPLAEQRPLAVYDRLIA